MLERTKIMSRLCVSVLFIGVNVMLTACNSMSANHNPVIPIVVGTYTGSADEAGVKASEGIYVLQLDPDSGQLRQQKLLAAVESPSFVAIDSETQRLYVASETEDGQVVAYQWNADSQQLDLINSVSSGGAAPCYVTLNPDRTKLAVANYVSGNISVYEIDPETGVLRDNPQQRQHSGKGPNQDRQEGPHAHWVQWDTSSRFLYVVDLGIDQVIGYAVDPESGTLGQGFTALRTEAGAGPRHLAFHPHKNLVYLLNELNNTVVVAHKLEDGQLHSTQVLNTLPQDFTDHSQAAHIEITADGNTLYVSNRGHNSIAVFDIADDGTPELVQWADTEGNWPRHFALLPQQKMVLVANQNTNNIVTFEVADNGRLSSTGQSTKVAKPVFIAPLKGFMD